MPKQPHLRRRGAVYWYRRRVPKDVTGAFNGKREVVYSLRTKERSEALRLLPLEDARWNGKFDRARRRSQKLYRAPTEGEIRQIALRWLWDRERADEPPAVPEVDTELGLDVAVLSNPADPGTLAAVQQAANDILSAAGIEVGENQEVQGRLRDLLRRAMLEHAKRSDARALGDYGATFDPAFRDVVGDDPDPQVATNCELTLDDLISRFSEDPSRADRQKKTLSDYGMLFKLLREVWGPDRRVSQISREDCRRVRDVLVALPPNATKRFRGRRLLDVVEHARTNGLSPMNTVTLNGYLGKLSTMMRWAEREEFIDKNPAVGLRVAGTEVSKREARRPFSPEQLRRIFNAPLYVGCVDDEANYAHAGSNHPRRARFWLPLLSLFHGLRLNEAAQLHVADIVEVEGVHVIKVEPGEGKRLKSDAARRFVPAHPEVVRLGFLDYVRDIRSRGETRLFPELRPDNRGYLSDHVQKWFARFLVKAGAKAPRTSFHSFRHCWRDALREAGVSQERVDLLGGWAGNGSTGAIYGEGLRPKTLALEVAKVRFPGLDLSHLHAR